MRFSVFALNAYSARHLATQAQRLQAVGRRTSVFKRPIERLAYRRDEAAAVLGVSTTKFSDWERRGLVPRALKIDGLTLYDAQQLAIAWAAMRDGDKPEFDNGNPYDSE